MVFWSSLVTLIFLALFFVSKFLVYNSEQLFPAKGHFAEIEGIKIHYTDHPGVGETDLLPMVFIHGASGNLRDLEAPMVPKLKGRGRMIFVDRPGHGYSQRGDAKDMHLPYGQARIVSKLLKSLNIERAIIIGHSYGGSIAAAFAIQSPSQAAGLLFLAPATHPWPKADTSWYYKVADVKGLGWFFSLTLAEPIGQFLYPGGVKEVFRPNNVPENYMALSGTRLVLRPSEFWYNAQDVEALHGAVVEMSPQYKNIKMPTSIISGDKDEIVVAEIHSVGLERDIEGAKLTWLHDTGHMPAWTNPDEVITEIERLNKEAKRK